MPPVKKGETEQNIELAIRIEQVAKIVEKLEEVNEGTLRSRGIKEKLVIAEMNIEANKQAYLQTQEVITKMEERIGKSLVEAISRLQSDITTKIENLKQETITLQKEATSQRGILDKIAPYFNVLSWFILGAGGILLSLFLTGRLHVALVP